MEQSRIYSLPMKFMEVVQLFKGTFSYNLHSKISYLAPLKTALSSLLACHDKMFIKAKTFYSKIPCQVPMNQKTKSLYRCEGVSLYFSLIVGGKVLGRMSLSKNIQEKGFFN